MTGGAGVLCSEFVRALAYSGAKAAISNFTQWLAVYFSRVGIRVNAIAPGFIRFRYGVDDPAPVVEKAMKGEALTEEEIAIYQGALLRFLAGEYHRRILCNKLGTLVEEGQYPCDIAALGEMVRDICHRNAVNYFGLRQADNLPEKSPKATRVHLVASDILPTKLVIFCAENRGKFGNLSHFLYLI